MIWQAFHSVRLATAQNCSQSRKSLGVRLRQFGPEAAIVPKMNHDGPYGLSPDDRMTRQAEAMVEQCRQSNGQNAVEIIGLQTFPEQRSREFLLQRTEACRCW
jgi:hypothetical protein